MGFTSFIAVDELSVMKRFSTGFTSVMAVDELSVTKRFFRTESLFLSSEDNFYD